LTKIDQILKRELSNIEHLKCLIKEYQEYYKN